MQVKKAYPVQSKCGSTDVRAWPFFKQYNQPSWECLVNELALVVAKLCFTCTDLWELQEALKQSRELHMNKVIKKNYLINKMAAVATINPSSQFLRLIMWILFLYLASLLSTSTISEETLIIAKLCKQVEK